MSNRPTPPSVTEYAIAERAELLARIEEQAREIERIQVVKDNYCALLMDANQEISTMKSQPSGVVLPEQDGSHAQIAFWAGYELAVCGLHNGSIRTAWNDFKGSDQFRRISSTHVSAGVVDERAAFDDWARIKYPHADRKDSLGGFSRDMRKSALDGWQARAALTTQPDHSAQSEVLDSAAAKDVLAERRRQVEKEGWTPGHDDSHDDCALAAAAATYALCTRPDQLQVCGVTAWPWADGWWKPGTYRQNLVKSGALILAEIERLDRAAAPIPDKEIE